MSRHDLSGFTLCHKTLGEVQIHFIPIEISIVSAAIAVVHSDCLLFRQYPGLMSHYGWFVQSGLSVYEQNVPIN